ncbi:hypothetical protein PFFCH_03316, partial [Plasmodium falciparum FCH/4]
MYEYIFYGIYFNLTWCKEKSFDIKTKTKNRLVISIIFFIVCLYFLHIFSTQEGVISSYCFFILVKIFWLCRIK